MGAKGGQASLRVDCFVIETGTFKVLRESSHASHREAGPPLAQWHRVGIKNGGAKYKPLLPVAFGGGWPRRFPGPSDYEFVPSYPVVSFHFP